MGRPTAERVPGGEGRSRPLLYPNLAIQNYKMAQRVERFILVLLQLEQDGRERVVARGSGPPRRFCIGAGSLAFCLLEYPTIAKGAKCLAFPDTRIQESAVAPHCASERQVTG